MRTAKIGPDLRLCPDGPDSTKRTILIIISFTFYPLDEMAVKFLHSCTLSQVTFLIFPGNNFLQRKVLLRIKYYHCTPCDSVFTLMPKTMQTTQYRKPRIWEMRVDKYIHTYIHTYIHKLY